MCWIGYVGAEGGSASLILHHSLRGGRFLQLANDEGGYVMRLGGTDAIPAVQLMMSIGCTLVGTSHIVQPRMWQDYLAALHKQGSAGVLTSTMTWELWPALILATLHPVWRGPAVLLTTFGWLLLVKCAVSLCLPQLGLRSLALAERGPLVFIPGGLLIIWVGFASGLALLWR